MSVILNTWINSECVEGRCDKLLYINQNFVWWEVLVLFFEIYTALFFIYLTKNW